MDDIEGNMANVPDSDTPQSLTEELRGLINDLQDTVQAEVQFHRTRISFTVRQTKQISILLVGIAIFSSVAMISLIIGLLYALIPAVGIWGAVTIITTGCIVLAGICLLIVVIKSRRLKKLYRNTDKK